MDSIEDDETAPAEVRAAELPGPQAATPGNEATSSASAVRHHRECGIEVFMPRIFLISRHFVS